MTQVAVHGHFYQPPRENPWTGEIDAQPSAAPFHDWNELVHAECYRPNAFVNLSTDEAQQTVNNFERISFDVGPTLMSWLEKKHPATYDRIVAADRMSADRLGHGNAIAQAFHHPILPLSSPRDVRTEVRWGISDFRHRFERDPEGLWLPETAANDFVLSVLIDEGMSIAILAPHQADCWRENGRWINVKEGAIDLRRPYRYKHQDGSGRSIVIFFYDAGIAEAIAFQNAMASAPRFLELFMAGSDSDGQLMHAATDGESYGHHHKFGDVGLAHALFIEAQKRGAEATNYAAYLESFPPRCEVKIVSGEGTSWSCPHGVMRWLDDCGCSTRSEPGWNQRWRAPLRRALEAVRDVADDAFDRMGRDFLVDPWVARDGYVDVAVGGIDPDEFVARQARRPLTDHEKAATATLLEMQRSRLAMFASCAWFFADIGDIEPVQTLRYAARTIELLEELGAPSPEPALLSILSEAESNDREKGTGADIYRALARG